MESLLGYEEFEYLPDKGDLHWILLVTKPIREISWLTRNVPLT